jgi:hypothetical protein
MPKRKIGRREFLKLAIASTAAAGLSHFRVLNIGGTDVALAQGPCTPPDEPDVCEAADPDECLIPDDTDFCFQEFGDQDVCNISEPLYVDQCGEPGGAGTITDICEEDPGDPDICYNPGNIDTCTPPDTDLCVDPGGGGGQVPDTCVPPGDPDDPNPVTVGSVGAESASSILPSLGGVAAALGAAALWLRHRLRPEKPEEPETE